MGVDHVMTMQNFGNMAPAYVTNSMRLLAERVMPQVPRDERPNRDTLDHHAPDCAGRRD